LRGSFAWRETVTKKKKEKGDEGKKMNTLIYLSIEIEIEKTDGIDMMRDISAEDTRRTSWPVLL
jgi:hypothetical protein